jgi:hypothetical protein
VVERVVESCSPGEAPKPLTPATSLADYEPKFASVGLVAVEIDIADEEASVDRPQSDQAGGR